MRQKIFIGLLFFTLGGVIFFFVGRSTIEVKTETKFVKGKTISDTVYIPAPYAEKKAGKDKLVPVYKEDTSGKETSELDTVKSKEATIQDWNLERKYANLVFDNENGKFLYDITVKNNKLSNFSYTFTPVHKVTTSTRGKIFQPFISGSYSTFGYVGIGGGVFYHKLGIEYQYQLDYKNGNTGHMVGGKWRF
ncbi:MAG: hypothetical protein LBQ74_17770 [Prevotella sp.]|jgi:hypothetical protein|nr:hypothetical protein [Prevotella sp.]